MSKSYSPFGEQLGVAMSGYGFNGEYYDSATGMLNLRARQYEPAQMRFGQRDLLKGDASEPLSLNRYLYCQNDSINYADFSGQSLKSLWNKAKSVAKSAVKAVAKVVTNTVKAVATKAVAAVAKVATKVVAAVAAAKTVINTVKEVASAVKAGNTKKAIATAVSGVAKVGATYVAAKAVPSAIDSVSASIITDLKADSAKALSNFVADAYGELSPRNQEIMSNAAAKMKEMQANGATEQEIAKVFLTACREIGKNVGGTTVEAVKEEIIKPTIDATVSSAKDRISYNDDDTTAFGAVKMAIGSYVGSVAGMLTMNPVLGTQVAADTTKYLNENPFTISVRVQADAAIGGAASGSKYITLDSKGNLVAQHSNNVGAGTPSVGVSVFASVTNAPSYESLQASQSEGDTPSLVSGGSFGELIVGGYDYTYMPYDGGNYAGHTISIGTGLNALPVPADIHSQISYTYLDGIILSEGR